MKKEKLIEYLNKIITYKTVWGDIRTEKLIKLGGYFATFEKDDGNWAIIKTFNIAEIY